MRKQRYKWLSRCPADLGRVHVSAMRQLECLNRIWWTTSPEVDHSRGSDIPQRAADLAHEMLALLDEKDEGLADVEEDFGAVADGVVEFSDGLYVSVHSAVIRRTIEVTGDWFLSLVEDEKFVEYGLSAENSKILMKGCSVADRADAVSAIMVDWLLYFPRLFVPWGVAQDEFERLTIHLRQELFRAWKHRCLGSSVPQKTMAEAETPAALEKADQIIGAADEPPRRPAYGRDHLWLKWREEEGLTPAKIRDRWNDMTDGQRKAICPKHWKKVVVDSGHGKRTKQSELDTIKKGLKAAKGDHQRTGEN